MNYVPYAVPFFILAMAFELMYGRLKRRNTYAFADTLNSLQLGTLSRLRGVIQLGLIGIAFDFLVTNRTLFDLDPSALWVWVFTFIAYDLCYYFSHRYGHEWRILWASHVVHHQSEEFNLSTALRQTSTGWLNSIFYLPLYIIGVPVELMISVGSLNLIYQFWVHTEHVRRIGWLEWVLVTPSNHRVHHAKNPNYIDRNYGGVFIVWDRLFSTFQDELDQEPCRYGITHQLKSWNPLWANFHGWYDGWQQSRQTPKWTDKIKVWFKSPAWTAPSVSLPNDDWQAPKFQASTSTYANALSFFHFWPHVGAVFLLLAYSSQFSQEAALSCAAWLALGFYVQGALLEGRPNGYKWEWLRLAMGCALSLWLAPAGWVLNIIFAYLVISAGLSIGLAKTEQSDDRLQSPG